MAHAAEGGPCGVVYSVSKRMRVCVCSGSHSIPGRITYKQFQMWRGWMSVTQLLGPGLLAGSCLMTP